MAMTDGHRLDAGHVDLVQLLDEAEDGVELAPQRLGLVVGHGDAGETRHALHGFLVDRHAGNPTGMHG